MKNFTLFLFTLVFVSACSEEPFITPYIKNATDINEIKFILETLRQSLETDSPYSIQRIENCFVVYYQASTDEVTSEFITLGIIPKSYIDILPKYLNFFENYDNIIIEILEDPMVTFLSNTSAYVKTTISLVASSVRDNLTINYMISMNFIFSKIPEWRISYWRINDYKKL